MSEDLFSNEKMKDAVRRNIDGITNSKVLPLMADELQEVKVCAALMEASLSSIMRAHPTSHVVLGLADILSRILRAQTDPKRGLEIFTRIVQERLEQRGGRS